MSKSNSSSRIFRTAFRKYARASLTQIIGRYFPLSDAVPVNEMLVSGVGVQGKLLFVVDKDLAKGKL